MERGGANTLQRDVGWGQHSLHHRQQAAHCANTFRSAPTRPGWDLALVKGDSENQSR